MSDNIKFKPKIVTKNKEGQYIMIKSSIHQENITITYICAPNIGALGASKYIKQILTDLKGEINNTIIVGDVNTPPSTMDKSSRQKKNH